MDVDDAPVQALAQGGGEDLHVARQHHQLDVELADQPQQLASAASFVSRVTGMQVKGAP